MHFLMILVICSDFPEVTPRRQFFDRRYLRRNSYSVLSAEVRTYAEVFFDDFE